MSEQTNGVVGEEGTLQKKLKGKWVIVRSRNEGVNFGCVDHADPECILITQARRLWFYRPHDTEQSWFEGVANTGVSKDSKLSPSVDMKAVVESYSVTLCTPEAIRNLQAHPSHQQTRN